MTEAERRGGIFDGAIGELVHEPLAEPDPRSFNVIIRKEANAEFFHLETSGDRLVPDPEVHSNAVSPPLNLLPVPERRFFPFRPKQQNNKHEATGYKEWRYVPSCSPFLRSCAVTDGTVYVPQDSRKYSSNKLHDDKADKGYLTDEFPERRYWFFFRVLIPLGISLTPSS